MKSACFKDIFRQIRYNPRRFVAIFLIVTLGVAFYSGVRAASPDMRLTVNDYLDENYASDVQLLSTLGFDNEDVETLQNQDGVQQVMPMYTTDRFLRKQETTLLISFQSLDIDKMKTNPKSILNRPVLIEGKIPQTAQQCLMDETMKEIYGYQLGETIVIEQQDESSESLNNLEYTIAGFVRSVQYISYQRGSSNKGSGKLSGFIFLPKENFNMDVYTQIYLKAENIPYSRFSDEYEHDMEQFCKKIEAVGIQRSPQRYEQLKKEAEERLESGRNEIANGEKELADAQEKLVDGEHELAQGENELKKNRQEYEKQMAQAKNKLVKANAELLQAKATIEQKQQHLDAGKRDLEDGYNKLEASKRKLDEGKQGLTNLQIQIDQLSEQLSKLPPQSEQAQKLRVQLSNMQIVYNQKNTELEQGKQQYESGMQQLNSTQAELAKGEEALGQARAEYESGKKIYENNWDAYQKAKADGANKLSQAQKELESSRDKLAEARREYEQQKTDALDKLEKARHELADGEKQLRELKQPEWFVLGLDKNIGFAGYKQDADRIAAIGLVFPLIFFLVAALVSLTNMTRMVEDDRTTIGVMKALGYGRFAIASKYLVYAGLAAVGGIALGIAVGNQLFPRVIYDAYGIMYTLPPVKTPINMESAIQAGIGALLCAVFPAFIVCQKELFSTPASLMRPRAPRKGKRILLERLPLWKHLNFSQKVTCRNIFRYKKRLFMTVLGIAGCTALVFTGFGLKDSIRLLVPLQYDEIQKYDMTVALKDSVSTKEMETLDYELNSSGNVASCMVFHRQSGNANANGQEKSVTLIVPQDRQVFEQFITLRNRRNGKMIPLTNDGVIISEKLGRMLNIQKGDTLEFKDSDHQIITVSVNGLTENYVNQYMYMTPTLYEHIYGTSPNPNALFGRLNDTSKNAENMLSERLLQSDTVRSVSYNTVVRSSFDDMLRALDIVVLILIVSAAALAFVVLFSLTNINIDERKRELATLKVLGFYDGETAMYLYRENIILTLLGIAAGLVFGIFLLMYVLATAEVDMLMFSRRTHWTNYVISSLITAGFAAVVNAIMSTVINRIDMVESLKSIE